MKGFKMIFLLSILSISELILLVQVVQQLLLCTTLPNSHWKVILTQNIMNPFIFLGSQECYMLREASNSRVLNLLIYASDFKNSDQLIASIMIM